MCCNSKGEKKRALKFKVYFDAVTEDIVENARLAFFHLKHSKIVAEDMIKTELKKEILPLHIKSRLVLLMKVNI